MFILLGKLLLIIAVSLDSFGVGISYGLRRIKIPLAGLLITGMNELGSVY